MASDTRVDLDDLDAQLRALGVDLDDDTDDVSEEPSFGPGPVAGDPLPDPLPPGLRPPQPRTWDSEPLEHDPAPHFDDLDVDPDVDLPAPSAPPGYLLDRRGVLRYAHDRSCVPGQQRVTLDRLWRFERSAGDVLVPELWVRSRPELWWCERWGAPYASTRVAGVSVAAHPVPEPVWDRYAAHPIAVTAPELAVANMLDAAAVADLAGLSRSAVPTYLARGVLPEPQARVANSPLWSLPPLGVWLATRRDPGRPPRRRT